MPSLNTDPSTKFDFTGVQSNEQVVTIEETEGSTIAGRYYVGVHNQRYSGAALQYTLTISSTKTDAAKPTCATSPCSQHASKCEDIRQCWVNHRRCWCTVRKHCRRITRWNLCSTFHLVRCMLLIHRCMLVHLLLNRPCCYRKAGSSSRPLQEWIFQFHNFYNQTVQFDHCIC